MIVEWLQRNLPWDSVSPPIVFQGYGEVSSVVALTEGGPGGRAWFVGLTRGRGRDHRVPLTGGDGEGGHKTVIVAIIRGEFAWKNIYQSSLKRWNISPTFERNPPWSCSWHDLELALVLAWGWPCHNWWHRCHVSGVQVQGPRVFGQYLAWRNFMVVALE